MKKELYIDPHTKHIVIEGKQYVIGRTRYKKVDGIKHIDRYDLEEVDPKDEDILNEIARKLAKKVSPEKIIKEALKKQLGVSERKRLLKVLKVKKAKVTEQDGCYGIVVDGKHFQIFE